MQGNGLDKATQRVELAKRELAQIEKQEMENISCALFGVTFQFAVRRDIDIFQLKSGKSAAFGFVKGLATVARGPPMELEAGSILSHTFSGAVFVSENLLIFLFAGVGLDFCIKLGILSPFPIEPSVSTTETD